MVRVRVFLLLLLAVTAVGVGGLAAESNGFSGTIGAEAVFLPDFSTDVWLNLGWSLDGFSFGSLTGVSVFPGFAVSETMTAGYSFGVFDFGGTVAIDVYPFAFGGFDLHAGVGLLDSAQDGFAVSADAALFSAIYPTFGAVLSLDVYASYGIFSLWADFDLDILSLAVDVLLGGEVRLLDLEMDSGGLTADLGASTLVLPAVDAQLWLDMALELGAVSVTSGTDFALTPFGLTQQRFEVEIGLDGLSVHAWVSFNGAGDLSAGIGGTYDFP